MTADLARDVAALLTSRGWTVVRGAKGHAALWALPEAQVEMYVPSELRRGSFEWNDIIKRIAAAHREPARDVERRVEVAQSDVMRFRVDSSGSETIPLEAGATVIGSAFGMLRAAATTARRPRQAIGSNYSKVGDDVVRGARLAHTEVGSFVFPVLLRVPEPEDTDEHALDGVASARPESEQRRVVRTLAQALQTYERHVIEPAREPRPADLTPVVIAGGTKEMFAQVGRALDERGVSWLETSFDWAATESTANDAPRRVVIPSDARDIVTATVRLLSTPRRNPFHVFTGPITQIAHQPGDLFGEIVIQTPSPTGRRGGRLNARVRADQLSQIHQWMDTSTTIVVQGEVERLPGRMARLRGIAEPQALSDTALVLDD